MIDISSWTDEQVNEAIAVKRGWKTGRVLVRTSEEHVRWTNGVLSTRHAPDYTHSWDLCGELLEEMKPADVDLMYFMSLNKWGVDWVDNDDVEHEVVADTPTRAICEAWLPWKEQG